MGRKKRSRAQLKPFCFYCDREFDDEKVLIQHQKAKHFKCSECNRKLDTATGLVVHMLQVHKETINRVPNANSGRDNPELIIHGMDGVPLELINERQAKYDEERGAVRHSKSAHTTFGVSVMSGFFNQIQTGPHGMPPMMPPGFNMMGGQPNPFAINQFMAQMQHGPQAAFTAMFGLPAPKIDGAQFSALVPGSHSTALASSAGMSASQIPSTSLPTATGFGPPTGFSARSIPIVPPQPSASTSASQTEISRLPGALSSALAVKTGVLIFDPLDDTMSPEELRAQRPQYSEFNTSLDSHEIDDTSSKLKGENSISLEVTG